MGWDLADYWEAVKITWLDMLEPPWLRSERDDTRGRRASHWSNWMIGWLWTIAGLILGAFVAPSFVEFVGLQNTVYQDYLYIGVAALAGFLVQILGWILLTPLVFLALTLRYETRVHRLPPLLILAATITLLLLSIAAVLLPIGAVIYGIYGYLTWFDAGQRAFTIAFVGGLLVKTFLVPIIKGIATGAAIKFLIKWLRGNKSAISR